MSEDLISQVRTKRWFAVQLEENETFDGMEEPIEISYECPACGNETFVIVDKSDESVKAHLAAGIVPPSEVELCANCEPSTQETESEKGNTNDF